MRLFGRMGMAAGCAAMLAACGDVTGSGGDPMEFGRAFDLWNSKGIDDYRMTVRLQGGWLGGAAVIEVRDGVPVSVRPIAPGEGLPPEAFRDFDTVDELFGILANALNHEADRIDARYDRFLGVPLDVYIDPDTDAIDEEHGFLIEAFQVL
jgi:hypothetical protein